MIRKLEYYKKPPRVSRETYGNIKSFVYAIQEIMKVEGNVLLVIEPGDAAHYEFLLIQCGCSLAVAASDYGWSLIINCDPMTLTPGYIEDHVGMKINPYTTGVLCQILHDIYGGSGEYYSWEKAIPIERVVPGGKETESS